MSGNQCAIVVQFIDNRAIKYKINIKEVRWHCSNMVKLLIYIKSNGII